MRCSPAVALGAMLSAILLCHCSSPRQIVVSVAEQRLALYHGDRAVATYPVSTSKFGLGDRPGSKATPLGRMKIASKVGRGAPPGAVFKDRRRTGEVLRHPDAPGRDPIVTRILWLKGLESRNQNTFRRYIYIHGTPEERKIGTRASYGCIRMRSRDIIDLYDRVGRGTSVTVLPGALRRPW